MAPSSNIWLVTGVSSGFGRCIAEEAAARGGYVVGTVRKPADADAFARDFAGRGEPLFMDVDYPEQIKAGVADILTRHKRIDVLVNNSGYGLFGAIEEVSEAEARAQMETNFFGALWLTQAVLPSMRAAKSGAIVQISSVAGFCALPGVGLFNASKFALEGLSEALAQEVAPLGIKVMIVEPGPFRTKWAGEGSRNAAKQIGDYDATAHVMMNTIHGYSGKQPGDPAKGAKLIVEAVHSAKPPLRLPLGQNAITRMRDKMAALTDNIAAWEKQAAATDFAD